MTAATNAFNGQDVVCHLRPPAQQSTSVLEQMVCWLAHTPTEGLCYEMLGGTPSELLLCSNRKPSALDHGCVSAWSNRRALLRDDGRDAACSNRKALPRDDGVDAA